MGCSASTSPIARASRGSSSCTGLGEVGSGVSASTTMSRHRDSASTRGTSTYRSRQASRRASARASAATSVRACGLSPSFTNARQRPRSSKTWSTGLRLTRALPTATAKVTLQSSSSSRWWASESGAPMRMPTRCVSTRAPVTRTAVAAPSRRTTSAGDEAALKRRSEQAAARGGETGTSSRGWAASGTQAYSAANSSGWAAFRDGGTEASGQQAARADSRARPRSSSAAASAPVVMPHARRRRGGGRNCRCRDPRRPGPAPGRRPCRSRRGARGTRRSRRCPTPAASP
ncbi:hypothetical protein NOMA109596_15210 [Nocardioides marinus]